MHSTISTRWRRGAARIAVAGALVAVPLGALAVTASAQTPDPTDAVPVVSASDTSGAEIAEHPRHRRGHDEHEGPRVQFRGPEGPGAFFHQIQPPTGSAG
ncbi:hypothetical protein [Nocardia bovistercoris]|uniref:Uncharacterized protein n=1 Tax=Nocardia bovistercoris TaxID=2785916 RepID=A0A931N1Y6_9NOCA|nr:hypothetical protein [Nocardia bovistercoris]MBH0778925.1 hypothetical protein [Nocardia bovistercoris]